jgi:hypothetical protein
VLAKVADAADNAYHGAGIEVARAGMPDNLTSDTVFLSRERECNERDASEVGEGTSERVESGIPDEQLDVAETKGVTVTGAAVLAWSEEPEESKVA